MLLLQLFRSSFVDCTGAVQGPAAGQAAGGIPSFSDSLGSLLWVLWWGGEHKDTYIKTLSFFHQQIPTQEDESTMSNAMECPSCRWCLCTKMHSVAFLCSKSARLFLEPEQSLVYAVSYDAELLS